MPNRLKLTGILTPPADDAWQPGIGYVKFEPADDRAANWSVPGYRPAWPIIGIPNGLSSSLMEINGGDIYVPGDEPGDTYTGPTMKVSYELRTTAGTWHRGGFVWRAVSTGGGVIDIRTPAPEAVPPTVSRPGVPANALLTSDVDSLVPSQAAFNARTLPAPIPVLAPLVQEGQGAPILMSTNAVENIHVTANLLMVRYAASFTCAVGFSVRSYAKLSCPVPPGWLAVSVESGALEDATGIPLAVGSYGVNDIYVRLENTGAVSLRVNAIFRKA